MKLLSNIVGKASSVTVVDDTFVANFFAAGFFVSNNGTPNSFQEFGVQSDGKVVASQVRTLRRFNADGTIDNTFNTYYNDHYSARALYCICIQPDDKILIGTDTALIRLNADGSFDTSYQGPIPGTPGSSGPGPIGSMDIDPTGTKVALACLYGLPEFRLSDLQPNGINYTGTVASVFVRYELDGRIIGGQGHFNRFFPNGTVDSSFNLFGAGEDNFYDLIPLPNGQWYCAGGPNFLYKLFNDGSIDSSFNIGSGPNARLRTLKALPDGRLVIGGDFTSFNGDSNVSHFAVIKPDGTIDYSGTPSNQWQANDNVTTIIVQSGSVYASGASISSFNGTDAYMYKFDIGSQMLQLSNMILKYFGVKIGDDPSLIPNIGKVKELIGTPIDLSQPVNYTDDVTGGLNSFSMTPKSYVDTEDAAVRAYVDSRLAGTKPTLPFNALTLDSVQTTKTDLLFLLPLTSSGAILWKYDSADITAPQIVRSFPATVDSFLADGINNIMVGISSIPALYVSDDAGGTFNQVQFGIYGDNGLPTSYCQPVFMFGNTFVVYSPDGYYGSADAGVTWALITTDNLDRTNITSIGGDMFTFDYTLGNYVKIFLGEGWQVTVVSPDVPQSGYSLKICRSDDTVIYMLADNVIYKSTNGINFTLLYSGAFITDMHLKYGTVNFLKNDSISTNEIWSIDSGDFVMKVTDAIDFATSTMVVASPGEFYQLSGGVWYIITPKIQFFTPPAYNFINFNIGNEFWDNTYLYKCVDTSYWLRYAAATW